MVLWEMLTLRKPFESMDRDQFFARVVRGGARPPIDKKCPKALSNLIQVTDESLPAGSSVEDDWVLGVGVEACSNAGYEQEGFYQCSNTGCPHVKFS